MRDIREQAPPSRDPGLEAGACEEPPAGGQAEVRVLPVCGECAQTRACRHRGWQYLSAAALEYDHGA